MMPGIVDNPSRDPRVEDPTNLWVVDPLARWLLPLAVRLGISANAVSIGGLLAGAAAAFAYGRWSHLGWSVVAFLFSIAWLVADSLDGMVARATGTTSAFGRELDGLCDHGVFALIYIALAASIGTWAAWSLTISASAVHALQSNLYEAERGRFHRRLRGEAAAVPDLPSRNPATRLYNAIAGSLDWTAAPFDRVMASSAAPVSVGVAYGRAAVPVLRLMVILSQNMRVIAIFLACLAGQAMLFCWFELGPLSVLTMIGILWHRRVEARFVRIAARAGAS